MIRCTLALATLATVPFVASVSPPTRGATDCIAHWRFQNGVKDVAAVENHLILDESGHDQNGLAIGNPVFRRVQCPTGNLGLEFARNGARVFVPDDELFELTDSLTLEAWVRVDRYADAPQWPGYVVFRGDDRPGFDPWFLGVRDTGQLVFAIADALNRGAAVVSPAPLPLARLIHVAGTYDHERGRLRLFVDGEEVAAADTDIRPAGALGGSRPGIGIGNTQTDSSQGFRGLIAEVRISAAALGPERFLRAALR